MASSSTSLFRAPCITRSRARRLHVQCSEHISKVHLDPPPPPDSLSCERGIVFSTGSAFYRAESSLGRDLSVLAAAVYKRSHGQLRVLDAMSGCGVRALRYLVQAKADYVFANDCNRDLRNTMVENLQRYVPQTIQEFANPSTGNCQFKAVVNCGSGQDGDISQSVESLSSQAVSLEAKEAKQKVDANEGGFGKSFCTFSSARKSDDRVQWQVTHEDANKLLMRCYLNENYFDLIDIDSFGSESWFIGTALTAARFGGLLYLTCTDGFSSGGHAPQNSLASYGAFIRPMPYANELGLRMVIGGVVKEAALRGMVVSPVFSVYAAHGPVFRVMLRVDAIKGVQNKMRHYQFIGYCTQCGNSMSVDWRHLGAVSCTCSEKSHASVKISGPLWTGPLHNGKDILDMIALAREWGWILGGGEKGSSSIRRSSKPKQDKLSGLLNIMLEESQPELPFGYIHLDEIAKRGKIPSPRRGLLAKALQDEGYAVGRSQVVPNALKTNCSMTECITLARSLHAK